MNNFIVATAERCIGCHTCEVACAVIHAGTIAVSDADYFPRLRVIREGVISAPVMCRQCERAPCIAACPVDALRQGENGIEALDARCIDCKSCMVACPFGAIEIVRRVADAEKREERLIAKCDLCAASDDGPACVRVCPTEALALVTPAALDAQQRKRQQQVAQKMAGVSSL
ncbi:4Fe-4S dicluster domain-containing protein [Erwinia oleae]|uniref:4Fe-4S dicluster domain-containing protein n=1 Tax=Erwinia oleae TaxID=796334 RepID=UPI00054F8F03|nr:4Fe-4S dicluster domain-containing protein [Erwinia oleae]